MNSAPGWVWHRWFGVAVLVATAGAAGWALGPRPRDARDPAPADIADARVATLSHAPARREPRAAIPSLPDATGDVYPDKTTAASEPSGEPADGDSGVVDIDALTRTLADGTESERYAALTQALQAGIDVPAELLQQTYGSDLSESVRLLALEAYVDSVSDDRDQVRLALQSALYDGSSAVQAEAQRRLSELERYESLLAETSPQGLR